MTQESEQIYPFWLKEHELIWLEYNISYHIQMDKEKIDKSYCDYLAAEIEAATDILDKLSEIEHNSMCDECKETLT